MLKIDPALLAKALREARPESARRAPKKSQADMSPGARYLYKTAYLPMLEDRNPKLSEIDLGAFEAGDPWELGEWLQMTSPGRQAAAELAAALRGLEPAARPAAFA